MRPVYECAVCTRMFSKAPAPERQPTVPMNDASPRRRPTVPIFERRLRCELLVVDE